MARFPEDMAELDAIVAAVFPKLVDVFHAGLADVQGNVVMLRVCCKIYYSITYMEIPKSLDTRPWMEGLFMLAAVNVETRDVGHPWWKLRKWLFSTMYRYFTRHCGREAGNVVGMMDPAPVCMRILHTTINSLSLYSQGHFLSPRVANTLLNMLDEAVRKPNYWSEIQPHISQVCFSEPAVVSADRFASQPMGRRVGDPPLFRRSTPDLRLLLYHSFSRTQHCRLATAAHPARRDPHAGIRRPGPGALGRGPRGVHPKGVRCH